MPVFRLSPLAAAFCGVLLLIPLDASARQDERAANRQGIPAFETETMGPVRIDTRSGVVRAAYRQAERKVFGNPDAFLRAERERFGWDAPEAELKLVRDERRSRSRHLTYQQTFGGLPVAGRSVRVNMDHAGRVSMVTSAFEHVEADEHLFDVNPGITPGAASQAAVLALASGRGAVSDPRLVIHDPAAPRLAWEMVVWPEDEPAELKVWVDARDGIVLSWYNQALAHHPAEDHAHPEHSIGSLRSDGSGYVYDPDPLFESGQSYGAPYVDNNDATNTALDAVRKTVTLRDITQDADGKWVLEGPHVRIMGRNRAGTTVYTPPAMDGPDDFFFDRSDDRFEAVNAYYHIDLNQRYVQSLGILDVQNNGVDVNPQALTSDNSFYYPAQNMIGFGTGGVDDAEDPSVVIHEYGHALLNGAAPNLLATQEGSALHEGFADYWQGSYYRNLVESGQSLRNDWRWVFLWDSGEGAIWSGRYLENNGTYPADVCTATSNSCGSFIYSDGMLWAATLMQVWDQLGRDLTDHLVLLSHYYLGSPVTFMDAAQAVIQADTDYYGGAHLEVLIEVFSTRGLIDASAYGPVIEHVPLLSTETTGETISVGATVAGVSSALSSVELVYRGRTFSEVSVAMERDTNDPNRFSAPLVLPTELDTVYYYVRAEDQLGNVTYEPETAPEAPHFFQVGTDTEAPDLDHAPPIEVTFEGWPIHISGSARDNFGIASVRLFWSVLDPDGIEVASGEELIADGNGSFDIAFPAALVVIENGSRIRYWLEAQDGSSSGNVARYPVSGVVERVVQAGALLRAIDVSAGSDLLLETGWSVEVPTYGTLTSPGAGPVVGTAPGGSYSESAGSTAVRMVPINLGRVSDAYLEFWHYYDTEFSGPMDPSGSGGSILDGGVVQYRSLSTPSWTALTPQGGYPASIESGRGNPLAGHAAFGGFSYGWRRATMSLPSEDGLEIQFVFGSDNGNDGQADRFAGWLLDGIRLVTQLNEESAAPEFTSVPAQTRISSTQTAPPHIEIMAFDISGVQDVWVDWTMTSRASTSSASARMTQAQGDLGTFVSVAEFVNAPLPGDVLTYSVRASDPNGNETTAGPFELRFRLFAANEALTSVWSTGSWHEEAGEWHFSMSIPTASSALVLEPRFTETNALEQLLVLDHEASFDGGSAGLLEISNDGGRTWSDLTPEGGYPGTARLDGAAPINGRRAFVGSIMREQARFDVSGYAGDEVQIRVQAASDGEGGFSDTWRLFSIEFRSQTETDAFTIESEFGLNDAFPNPTDGLVRLSWSLEEAGAVRLHVFDGLGRRVATIVDSQQNAGAHSLTWDTFNVPSGVYFLRLQSAGRTATKTLVVN
ncbi:MAG: T9SS type A sorting domain-containing protein [Rhodothermales bacterium]